MKFELNIFDESIFGMKRGPIELIFKKSFIDSEIDYTKSVSGYEELAQEGGWIVKVGTVGDKEDKGNFSNKNCIGFKCEKDELINHDTLEECMDYLDIFAYPKNLNDLIGYIWDDLYNGELTQGEAQEIFNELGEIITKYVKEFEKFSR